MLFSISLITCGGQALATVRLSGAALVRINHVQPLNPETSEFHSIESGCVLSDECTRLIGWWCERAADLYELCLRIPAGVFRIVEQQCISCVRRMALCFVLQDCRTELDGSLVQGSARTRSAWTRSSWQHDVYAGDALATGLLCLKQALGGFLSQGFSRHIRQCAGTGTACKALCIHCT